MFSISLKDFRGFHDQELVNIRPITILIGENSAGKSSFLAAVKYMLDFISGNEEASFNKDPFQLGTYEQLAHYRGGKPGRAKQICISLKSDVRFARRERTGQEAVNSLFSVTFKNSESQPTVSAISVSSPQGTLSAVVDGRGFHIEIHNRDGSKTPIQNTGDFPRVARNEFSRYWPFLLRDLRYRIIRGDQEGQDNLLGPTVSTQVKYLVQIAESFARSLPETVDATSAIRTKPLRTYTPGTETPDGEGSHVPFAIAKMFRSGNGDTWKALKENFESFGKSSGMFKEIGVKSFGTNVSDPFQIQLSLDGPKTNLVDLGYGTSQIIPILYNIASRPRNSLHLIQQPEVHLHPKAQASLGDYFVESFLRNKNNFILETHSDFIVDRIRQAIFQKRVNSSDVSILFFERYRLENKITEILLDDKGDPIDAPENYRSFFVGEELRNLGIK